MTSSKTTALYDYDFSNIEKISQRNSDDKLYNAYVHCKYLLKALKIIRKRYDEDYNKLLDLHDKMGKITDKKSLEYKTIFKTIFHTQDQFRLDHESFIIYVRILMDMIARTSWFIINDGNLAYRSFSDQKDWLMEHKISNNFDENYGKLLREETRWFSINLKGERDQFIVHAFPRFLSFIISRKRGIRINLTQNFLGTPKDNKDNNDLIAMKKKYENMDSNLKNVQDNMWEILQFVLNNDLELEEVDIEKIVEIRRRNGIILTDVGYIERKLFEFIKEFNNIFVP